jgi:hypothetical protein
MAAAEQVSMRHPHGARSEPEADRWGCAQCRFLFNSNSNCPDFESAQKMPFRTQKISNKIWACRKLNKEQLYLLGLLHIRNKI